jgi:transcriptional regulator with XRE-family HTH domain
MFGITYLVDSLTEWIESRQAAKGWTQAELARRAGISQGAISRVLSGSRGPGIDFCKAIAKAFGVPDSEVLHLAGFIDNPPDNIPGQDEMAYIYAHLPPERQEELRNYARYLLDQQDKRDAPAARPSPADA